VAEAVILSAVRTPIGRYGGALSDVRPDDLAALVIKEAVKRAGVPPAEIEDVYFGAANQAGEDNRDVARMAALLAGLPQSVAGVTVNRLCASGLSAVVGAAHAIRAGDGELFVAGGAAACIVLAIGAAAIILFHLIHLQRIADWAAGSLAAEVPEGRGAWATPLAAIYRHTRTRNAYERDLRHVIERFRLAAAALPDGVVVLDAAARIDWANPRALAQLGLDLAHDRGQPIVNLLRRIGGIPAAAPD